MKRVLVVAYGFPPSAASGVHRVLNLVRHLPSFGWEPMVVAAGEEWYEPWVPRDPSLFDLVPDSIVVRRARVARPIDWLNRVRGIGRASDPGESALKGGTRGAPKAETCAGFRGLLRQSLTDLLEFPDRQRGWIPFALREGLRLARALPVDAVFSTGGPWSSHLVGLRLSHLLSRPWIADFRDPWTTNPWRQGKTAGRVRREKSLEGEVVTRCRILTCTTEALTREFQWRFPEAAWKMHTVENGFDAQLGPEGVERPASGPLRLVHVGALYARRNPGPLMSALAHLIGKGKISADDVRLRVVGFRDVPSQGGEDARHWRESEDRLKELGVVSSEGWVPYREGLSAIASSHVGVVIQPGAPSQLPAKVYEYMGLGRPMLVLSEEGETARFVKGIGLGLVVPPDDVDRISGAVMELQDVHRRSAWEQRFPSPEPTLYAAQDRARRMADLLEGLEGQTTAGEARTCTHRSSGR